jgi:hypothetical protein
MKTLNILSDPHTSKGPIISRITRLFFIIKDIIFTYQNLHHQICCNEVPSVYQKIKDEKSVISRPLIDSINIPHQQSLEKFSG